MEAFQLITAKPVYVCNVDENSAVNGNKYVDQIRELVRMKMLRLLFFL
jgi:ribosome-binding ATPase YchF (GTP1/OBG family)